MKSTSGARKERCSRFTTGRAPASLWVEVIFPGLHPESSLKRWELRVTLLASLFLEKQVTLPGYIKGGPPEPSQPPHSF